MKPNTDMGRKILTWGQLKEVMEKAIAAPLMTKKLAWDGLYLIASTNAKKDEDAERENN